MLVHDAGCGTETVHRWYDQVSSKAMHQARIEKDWKRRRMHASAASAGQDGDVDRTVVDLIERLFLQSLDAMQMPRLTSHSVLKPTPPVPKPPDERDPVESESERTPAASFETARTKRPKKRRGMWDKARRHAAFVGPGLIASVAYVRAPPAVHATRRADPWHARLDTD